MLLRIPPANSLLCSFAFAFCRGDNPLKNPIRTPLSLIRIMVHIRSLYCYSLYKEHSNDTKTSTSVISALAIHFYAIKNANLPWHSSILLPWHLWTRLSLPLGGHLDYCSWLRKILSLFSLNRPVLILPFGNRQYYILSASVRLTCGVSCDR